jgi:peroxiredoxin
MRNFQQNLAKLEGADTQVLGVSVDSPFANHAFAEQNGITFPLLGDMGGSVTKQYGLLTTMNVKGVPVETAKRATFLIDKDGKIAEEQIGNEAIDPSKIVEACQRRKTGR